MNFAKSILAITFVATSLLFNSAYAADPTLHQVYQAAESGDLKMAQSMMDKVLRDHPNSAKAHFVEAEILAKQGKLDMAKAELGTAERLDPGLPFAKSESVIALKQRLNLSSHPSATVASSTVTPQSSFPWMWVTGGALLMIAFIFFIRSMNRVQVIPANAGANGTASNGFGNAYPQPVVTGSVWPSLPSSSGIGSGLLGGLATGAAVGAGIVAGEALMHKVLANGQQQDRAFYQDDFQAMDSLHPMENNFEMGGVDFGVSDNGSWDDGGNGSNGDDW